MDQDHLGQLVQRVGGQPRQGVQQRGGVGDGRGRFRVVDVPDLQYLMVDGHGDPNTTPDWADAVAALYPVAYGLKLASRRDLGRDHVVLPLEGLWWADDMSAFTGADKSRWKWIMMIMQPDFVPADVIAKAISEVRSKKALAALRALRLEAFAEGRCAQILHVGPFSEEGPTIARVHKFIGERSGLRGKHHEIYLSDIRRADSKKWRTIIRQPMR